MGERSTALVSLASTLLSLARCNAAGAAAGAGAGTWAKSLVVTAEILSTLEDGDGHGSVDCAPASVAAATAILRVLHKTSYSSLSLLLLLAISSPPLGGGALFDMVVVDVTLIMLV